MEGPSQEIIRSESQTTTSILQAKNESTDGIQRCVPCHCPIIILTTLDARGTQDCVDTYADGASKADETAPERPPSAYVIFSNRELLERAIRAKYSELMYLQK